MCLRYRFVFKSATTQAVSETRQIAQLLLVTPMNAHTQAPGVKAEEAGGGDKRGTNGPLFVKKKLNLDRFLMCVFQICF